ncbi:MAG: hypothetical protein QM642_03395 [Edaphocola sp.]
MDSHKDFIHIDEVFKRLRDGEEQEPAGAWLRMKDLLDKEMPVGAAPLRGGRPAHRYIIPALLLLLGGGFGYYQYSTHKEATENAHGATARISGINGNGSIAGTVRNDSNDDKNMLPQPGQKAANGNNTVSSLSKTEQTYTVAPVNSATKAGFEKPSSVPAGIAKNNSGYARHQPSLGKKAGNGHSAGSVAATPNAQRDIATLGTPSSSTGNKTLVPEKFSANTKVADNAMQRQNNAQAFQTQRVIEQVLPAGSPQTEAVASVAGMKSIIPAKGKKSPITINGAPVVAAADGTLFKEKRDTVKRIDMVSRTPAGNMGNGRNTPIKTFMDTVAVAKIERVRYTPLTPLETISVHTQIEGDTRRLSNMGTMHDKVTAHEEIQLVPLAKYKVGSKRVNPSKFNKLVSSATQGLAGYFDGNQKLYAALLAGGNAAFGNPAAFGMQLGLAAFYQLNERLALSAELRYVNHYYSNFTLNDQSVSYENVSGQQSSTLEWLFSGTKITTDAVYKVNNYWALELPVTLNYTFGRLSVFGGTTLAHAAAPDWIKQYSVATKNEVSQTNSTNNSPFTATNSTINTGTDFKSKFGLGYVGGASYDLSRKVSVDARLSQILWNNNNGSTSSINSLFRAPTIQLSIGYFFGRRDRVVYMMNKK